MSSLPCQRKNTEGAAWHPNWQATLPVHTGMSQTAGIPHSSFYIATLLLGLLRFEVADPECAASATQITQ